MPKIDLDKTVHAGGKVFFKGEAWVSEDEAKLIEAELTRLAELESEQPEEKSAMPKKTRTKSDK
jgi:hypothetical protein